MSIRIIKKKQNKKICSCLHVARCPIPNQSQSPFACTLCGASFVERTVLLATHNWRIIITPLILLCDERRFFAFFFCEANWIFYSLSLALLASLAMMQKDLNNDRMGNWAFTIQMDSIFFFVCLLALLLLQLLRPCFVWSCRAKVKVLISIRDSTNYHLLMKLREFLFRIAFVRINCGYWPTGRGIEHANESVRIFVRANWCVCCRGRAIQAHWWFD